jgi:hypothetical protein
MRPHLILSLPGVCDPSQPIPEFCWSDELPDHYFDRYVAAGGTGFINDTWSRSYDLAGLVPVLETIPTGAGNRIRALRGLAPIPHVEGMSEEAMLARLQAAWDRTERIIEGATRAARRWLA